MRVQTADGKDIPAHKLLLMLRCPCFEKMLGCQEFKEAESGVVKVRTQISRFCDTTSVLLNIGERELCEEIVYIDSQSRG